MGYRHDGGERRDLQQGRPRQVAHESASSRQGRGLIRVVRARREATGTAASMRGLGTLDLLLLEELIRVQGLVKEAALHRDSRGAGVEA